VTGESRFVLIKKRTILAPRPTGLDTGFKFFTALPPDVANVCRTEVDGAPAFPALTSTNNQFQFTVNGWAGTNYVVPATTNLAAANWIPLTTNAAPFLFIQTNASSFGQRFYRAKIWP
jgi:hypothetical protein